jgi:hypothetical protein
MGPRDRVAYGGSGLWCQPCPSLQAEVWSGAHDRLATALPCGPQRDPCGRPACGDQSRRRRHPRLDRQDLRHALTKAPSNCERWYEIQSRPSAPVVRHIRAAQPAVVGQAAGRRSRRQPAGVVTKRSRTFTKSAGDRAPAACRLCPWPTPTTEADKPRRSATAPQNAQGCRPERLRRQYRLPFRLPHRFPCRRS